MKRYRTAYLMLAVICAYVSWLRCADAAELEWFVTYDHTSALTRGAPFNNQLEHTQDFVGGGLTISVGARKRFEIDIAQGYKTLDASLLKGQFEEGTRISARFYPGRK